MRQASSQIMLVRPASFGFNMETSASNAFQNQIAESSEVITEKVLNEFDRFASILRSKGIKVYVMQDQKDPIKPDAIFPNNWISMHEDGRVLLYPMCAPNRRLERTDAIVNEIKEKFQVKEIIDFSSFESENRFLEGTGSIIFDHHSKIGYACLSPRTDRELLEIVCERIGYKAISFDSVDENGKSVYHTNVMMCIGEGYAVICLETIRENDQKKKVIDSLEQSGHEIVDISIAQMRQFAGNMLALQNEEGQHFLGMSLSAFESLNPQQKSKLEKYTELLPLPIPTIETIGGGSARCMMAEIFLAPQ